MYLGVSLDIGTPSDGTVTLAKMAVNSIDSDQYVDGSIDNAHIADDAIDSEHYAATSIDTAHIATNQIDETLMKDAFVGDFTDVTVTAADAFLYGDATDSGNTKKDTVQGILDLAVHTGNVAFPATQVASADANTLDDYEEGTYTPTIIASSGNDHTYTTQQAGYTKIGNLVHCFFKVVINSLGTSSGGSALGGLPFASAATAGHYGSIDWAYVDSLNIPLYSSMAGRVELNSNTTQILLWDSTTGTHTMTMAELSAGASLQGSLYYHV